MVMLPGKPRKDFTTLLKTDPTSFMLTLLQNFCIAVKWDASERDKRETNKELEDITSMAS